MQRVKSLRKGWVFSWKGTRDGKIYQLPENSDTGFYKLINPLCPPSENCPCMRLTPVKLAQLPKPKGIRHQVPGAKIGPKVYQTKPQKKVFGNTVVDSIEINDRDLTGLVLHAKIYGHRSGTTSSDTDRTRAAKKTKNKTSKKLYAAVVKEEEEQSWKRYLEEVEVFEETDPAQVSAVNKDKKNKNTRKFEVAEGSGGRTVSPRPPCLVFYKTHQNHLCVPGAHSGQWPKPVHAGDVYFPTDSNFSLEDLARVDWKDVVRAEEAEICRQTNVQDGSGPEGKSLEQMEDIPKCPAKFNNM